MSQEEHEQLYEIPLGKEVHMRLPANATTGYSWIMLNYKEVNLRLVSQDYQADQPSYIGGGGTQIFTFDTIKKGQQTLVFAYQRPWENNIVNTMVVTVNVV